MAKKEAAPTAFDSIDPPRNFTLGTEERIRAMTIGPPAYAVRKRRIEDTEAQWIETLVELRDKLLTKGWSEGDVDRAVREKAASFDYRRLNDLVALHNRWYPVEANLRIDPKTGGYLLFGRPWHPENEYTPERILARLSADAS